MEKAEFLSQDGVAGFVEWFAAHLRSTSTLAHFYELPGGIHVKFANLADALHQYEWPFKVTLTNGQSHEGRHFGVNTAVLDILQQALQSALAQGDDEAVCKAAIAVMQWGGVSNGNVAWLKRNQAGLAQQVREVAAILQQGKEERSDFPPGLRFNAGMTKVYSLLVRPLIIYDSRVAGALAWFVMQWTTAAKRKVVPDALNFPCMPAREGENAKIRKLRNPGTGKRQFQQMYNRPSLHAQWNQRASWILEAALAQAGETPFHAQRDALRGLEAALFMWGYDLGRNSPWLTDLSVADETDESEQESQAKTDAVVVGPVSQVLVTFGAALEFGWKFDEEADAVVISRKNGWVDSFTVSQLFAVLHKLYDQFEDGMIPLANDVKKLSDGTEKDGLGMAILTTGGKVQQAQAASYLGPILVALGLFEWNQKRHGMEFRFLTSLPASIPELRDLLTEYAC